MSILLKEVTHSQTKLCILGLITFQLYLTKRCVHWAGGGGGGRRPSPSKIRLSQYEIILYSNVHISCNGNHGNHGFYKISDIYDQDCQIDICLAISSNTVEVNCLLICFLISFYFQKLINLSFTLSI